MTTRHFFALASATAQAMAAVRKQHCPEPAFGPAAPVRASMRCPKCGGTLNYTASDRTGKTTGKCSSAGCVTWSEI